MGIKLTVYASRCYYRYRHSTDRISTALSILIGTNDEEEEEEETKTNPSERERKHVL